MQVSQQATDFLWGWLQVLVAFVEGDVGKEMEEGLGLSVEDVAADCVVFEEFLEGDLMDPRIASEL